MGHLKIYETFEMGLCVCVGGGMIKKMKKTVALFFISTMFFHQKSPRPPEEDVLQSHKQTNKQTDGHRDSMTESA